jgi:hypothetical protein
MPIENQEFTALNQHIEKCAVCTRAKKRVNDFCSAGRVFFAEWAKTQPAPRGRWVTIPKDQFERLKAETARADRSAKEN